MIHSVKKYENVIKLSGKKNKKTRKKKYIILYKNRFLSRLTIMNFT